MATLSARRWNPAIQAFFDRLTAAGKPFKLAMTACMRQLLTLLDVIVKNGSRMEKSIGRLTRLLPPAGTGAPATALRTAIFLRSPCKPLRGRGRRDQNFEGALPPQTPPAGE